MLPRLFLLTLVCASPAALAQGDPADDGAPDALAPLAAPEQPAPAGAIQGPAGDAPPPPDDGLTLDEVDDIGDLAPADPADGGAKPGAVPTTAEIGRRAGPSVVRVRADLTDGGRRFASGVFVGPREVATTASALYDAEWAEVDLGGDPRPFVVESVVAIDERRDLAVVRLREQDVGSRPIAFAPAAPKAGAQVWAVTFPAQRSNSRPDVAVGFMLAPTRRGTLQVDVSVDEGSWGGALVNARGELAGLLLPGTGEADATLAAEVDELRTLLRQRHQVVPLTELDRFLDDRAAAEGAYADGGYSDDDDYVAYDDEDGAYEEGNDSRIQAACVLGLCYVAPPLVMGAGIFAAGVGVCTIYGCAVFTFVALSLSRFAFIAGVTGATLGALAGVVALGALLAAAAPLVVGAGVGLFALGATIAAAGLGASALTAGAGALGLALSSAQSAPASTGPKAALQREQGLAVDLKTGPTAAAASTAVRY